MAFSIHWIEDGVVWEYEDLVTSIEVIESNRQIYGSPYFDELRFEIVNFVKAKQVSFTERDVRMIAAMDKAAAISNPRVRVALVADDKDIVELLELYQAESASTPWDIQLFNSIEEAAKWLEIELAQLNIPK